MVDHRSRQSAGQPTGGQFATEAKGTDTGVSLPAEDVRSNFVRLDLGNPRREWSTEERNEVASTIRAQVTPGVLMSLGAHRLGHFVDPQSNRPGLAMKTRILPYKANGERSSRPRNMRTRIIHEASDTYRVVVDYENRGEVVTHHEADGIHADQLAHHMLALDSDDDLEDDQ